MTSLVFERFCFEYHSDKFGLGLGLEFRVRFCYEVSACTEQVPSLFIRIIARVRVWVRLRVGVSRLGQGIIILLGYTYIA